MEKRNSFSGSIGFVLAAAGSAVGLGNIWRFPYLAAKDGGGLFLIVYLVLALTFGFALLLSEVSIGRRTHRSCLTAYGKMKKGWGWMGGIASAIPFIILPYYCVIGGWVLKYALIFITGQNADAASDSFFGEYITGYAEPIVFDLIFLAITCFVIFRGVNKGIESLSKILMPILLFFVIGISIFSLTISGSPENGGRTGMDGLAFYMVPDIDGMGLRDYITVVMDAMGQLFYSISVAMGIMVTYGSYFKDEDNLVKSVNQIEIFDTIVAFLAGVMVIPAMYVFQGADATKETAGPGLMFQAIPKVFAEMGDMGRVIGIAFFVMVFFAALTSSVSILEAIVSGVTEKTKLKRSGATVVCGALALVLGIVICLGYNLFFFKAQLPNQTEPKSQILDIFDYASNNVLMPVLAIATCILIGWVVKPKTVIDEATKNGEKMLSVRKYLYIAMVKVIAPILLFILLLSSFGLFDVVLSWVGL